MFFFFDETLKSRAKVSDRPSVGSTFYVVREHLYYVPNRAGPMLEYIVCAGRVAGSNAGTRQAMDAVIIWLHRNGWGKKRLQRLADGTNDVLKEFLPAFLIGMEQEVWQERMDRELRSALGDPDDFKPFRERYPIVPGTDFDHKPKS